MSNEPETSTSATNDERVASGSRTRSCAARGCGVQVPPKMLMCRKHWYMVPVFLRRAVWAAYRPGQEHDGNPSETYLSVMRAAVEAVAEREGR